MIKDYFRLALTGMRQRKMRSWLTILGIFVGIAAVVSLISLSQGMQDAINEQFNKVGTNRIMITPGGMFMGPTGSSMNIGNLTEDDVNIVSKVNGVDFATGALSQTTKVEYKDEAKYLSVWGMDTDTETRKMIDTIGFFEIKEGRALKESDHYSVILGYNIAYETFEKDPKLGDRIKVGDIDFEIVGIQKKAGTGVHDIIARIPKKTAREIYGEQEKVTTIFATAKEGFDATDVAEDIKEELRKSRDLEEGEEDFSIQSSKQLIQQVNTILGVVQIVLVGIAGISLLVGGIGIMNTMYTAVLERRKEIGIMKAIGARNSNIMMLFLIESGLMGLVGGLIGVLIGIGISKTVEVIVISYGITMLKANTGPLLIFGALAFSFVVGALSGILPAKQAANLKPVDALRKI